jgi:aldehyde dehydrogenase (NAD+)
MVGPRVAARFGRTILELGGNSAMIVAPTADLDLAVRAIVFSAVGTSGQRCTTLRRLIVHHSRRTELLERLKKAYGSLSIGDPREAGVLVGPLIDNDAVVRMHETLARARAEGGAVFGGGRRTHGVPSGGPYVREETFAPILYVLGYETLPEAIALQNDVPQGLSSCIFTRDLREAETFLSAAGSDCGIANVNIGPSGAEIGGAFGGEKETGGGRESGSDAWRGYMRRQTATVNYSDKLPLAQGVSFEI